MDKLIPRHKLIGSAFNLWSLLFSLLPTKARELLVNLHSVKLYFVSINKDRGLSNWALEND
jgi:hypothetical protein